MRTSKGKIILNGRREEKVASNLSKGVELIENDQYGKGIKSFKKVVRYKGKLTTNINLLKQEACGNLAEINSDLGNFEKALKYSEKCEKLVELLSDDFALEKFYSQMNKSIYLYRAVQMSGEKEKYLDEHHKTFKILLKKLKEHPSVLAKSEDADSFYNMLKIAGETLNAFQELEKSMELTEFVVDNYDYLKIPGLSDQNKNDLLQLISNSTYELILHKQKKRLLKKLLIFVVENFSSLDDEKSQFIYKDQFSQLIKALESANGYKKFDRYSSLFLKKYQDDKTESIDLRVVEVMGARMDKFFNLGDFDQALVELEKIKKYCDTKQNSLSEESEYGLAKTEADCFAGKGQFSKAEIMLENIKTHPENSAEGYLSVLNFLKIFSDQYEQPERVLKYCNEIIEHLDAHRDLKDWDLEYAEHLYFKGCYCSELNKPEKAEKAWQKCVDLYENTKISKVKRFVKKCKEELDG